MKLTHDQLTTVVSIFSGGMYRLEKSGDYPEKKEHKKILGILLNMQWEAKKRCQNLTS